VFLTTTELRVSVPPKAALLAAGGLHLDIQGGPAARVWPMQKQLFRPYHSVLEFTHAISILDPGEDAPEVEGLTGTAAHLAFEVLNALPGADSAVVA